MYAVRLTRGFTGKKIILKAAGGWHGANSDLSLGIRMPYEREESLGLLPELQQYTKVIPFNDLSGSLEIIHQNQKDLAGIILEPIIGEGGFIFSDERISSNASLGDPKAGSSSDFR